ncbi:hypothetical protein MKX01_017698 [Papaver californicum]|nr:hypothetical protein MKX01_017698 [Papaver californicum]
MAHRFLRDPEADGWERSDFPILCQSCLGDNPYVRMTRADCDKECKLCTRPFTVFRWSPGRDARYRKTEICRICSKMKNVCQVCLLDLDYGLPVQVRDTALSIHSGDSIPKTDVNREYYAEEHDRKARLGIDYESCCEKAPPSDTIRKLQRTAPYYKRNRAPPCTFYARGICNRGAACPYRHEIPVTGELSRQNIKDRYYGVNDPVAAKLLKKAGEMPSMASRLQATMCRGLISQRINRFNYFNIPPPPSQTCYPSMNPRRMGALVPSREGSNNRLSGSNDAQQRELYPCQKLSPLTQGNHPPCHPPYVPSPLPYQQFPRQRTGLWSPPAMGAQS